MEMREFLTTLALPPATQFVALVLGMLVWFWSRRLAQFIWAASVLSLAVLSMPGVSSWLARQVETVPVQLPEQLTALRGQDQVAIVVLGGGRLQYAPEFPERDGVPPRALLRLHYGAFAQQLTEFPILVSGGLIYKGAKYSEAELMAAALKVWSREARWLEPGSGNTWENARLSAQVLRENGYDTVLLVTDALHMPRSVFAFEQAGLSVIPAPVLITGKPCIKGCFMPQAWALYDSAYTIREILGMFWYRWQSTGQP